jgi:hypothetical protein
VAKGANLIHGNNSSLGVRGASSPKVVSHIVVKDTAKTSSSAFKVLSDFNVDGLFTVPFHHQAVSLLFDNYVSSNVADMNRKEGRWKGHSFTFFVESDWVAVLICLQMDMGILKINFDFPGAHTVGRAVWVINDSDGERARVSVLN